jgi:Transposase DDE domain
MMPKSDTFRCPGDQRLTKRGYNKNEQGWYYRADTSTCAACVLRSQCTKTAHPAHTRLIVRPEGHELLLRGWSQADSREAKRDRHRRMTLIEGNFGQAAQNHHFKRARYRRLWRQSIQDQLIAAVQNIKKIIQHGAEGGNTAVSAVVSIIHGVGVHFCRSLHVLAAEIFAVLTFDGSVLSLS